MTKLKKAGALSGNQTGQGVTVSSGLALIAGLLIPEHIVDSAQKPYLVAGLTPVFSWLLPSRAPWKT